MSQLWNSPFWPKRVQVNFLLSFKFTITLFYPKIIICYLIPNITLYGKSLAIIKANLGRIKLLPLVWKLGPLGCLFDVLSPIQPVNNNFCRVIWKDLCNTYNVSIFLKKFISISQTKTKINNISLYILAKYENILSVDSSLILEVSCIPHFLVMLWAMG